MTKISVLRNRTQVVRFITDVYIHCTSKSLLPKTVIFDILQYEERCRNND